MLTEPEGQRDACDVIVVGAGLVGAAVAARLSKEGFRTAILEARRVAGGATGRSLGVASLGVAGHYGWAVSVYGREKAREMWTLTAGGQARLVEAARRVGVEIQRSGSLALAADAREADLLWESAKLLQDDGFDAAFDLEDPLGCGFEAALRSADDVTVDAAALTHALLDAADAPVHEGCEVYALESVQSGVRVWARGRTVVCRGVVVTVNGYAALMNPYLAEHVAPVAYRVLAVEPPQDLVLGGPCTVDYGRGILRSLPDGRLLLGVREGQGSLGGPQRTPCSPVEVVERLVPGLDPARADRWSELVGVTPDGLPLLGQVPGLPEVYFAVGFGGRGLSWAFVAAERLVRHMLYGADLGLLSAERLPVLESSLR